MADKQPAETDRLLRLLQCPHSQTSPEDGEHDVH